MKLTVKCKYGIRIIIQILFGNSGEPINGKSLSAANNISEPYLEQIMSPLVSAKILRSVRGPGGGYVIERDISEISLLDIIEAYEGKIDFSETKSPDNTIVSGYGKDAEQILTSFHEKVRETAARFTLKHIYDSLIKNRKKGEYMI